MCVRQGIENSKSVEFLRLPYIEKLQIRGLKLPKSAFLLVNLFLQLFDRFRSTDGDRKCIRIALNETNEPVKHHR